MICPATINADLPEEVRYLVLLTLGQLYAEKGDYERARGVLLQALARPLPIRLRWLPSNSCWVMSTSRASRPI